MQASIRIDTQGENQCARSVNPEPTPNTPHLPASARLDDPVWPARQEYSDVRPARPRP